MNVFATYDPERRCWITTETSILSLLDGSEGEVFDMQWPRAGSVRMGTACLRASAHVPPRDGERLWPTPAASLPNDGEKPAQWLERFVRNATREGGAARTGVPLAVAAKAPVVLRVAKIGSVDAARTLLKNHERSPIQELASRETLNPAWVEMLMGFPEGWTTS